MMRKPALCWGCAVECPKYNRVQAAGWHSRTLKLSLGGVAEKEIYCPSCFEMMGGWKPAQPYRHPEEQGQRSGRRGLGKPSKWQEQPWSRRGGIREVKVPRGLRIVAG